MCPSRTKKAKQNYSQTNANETYQKKTEVYQYTYHSWNSCL